MKGQVKWKELSQTTSIHTIALMITGLIIVLLGLFVMTYIDVWVGLVMILIGALVASIVFDYDWYRAYRHSHFRKR
jgi:membrane-bound ClpP family serine protease